MDGSCFDAVCDCIGGSVAGFLCCPCLTIWGCSMLLCPGIQKIISIVDEVLDSDLLCDKDLGIKTDYLNSWLRLGFKCEDNPQRKCVIKNRFRDIIWRQIAYISMSDDVSKLTSREVKYIVKQLRYYLQTAILCYYEKNTLFWNPDVMIHDKSGKEYVEEFLKNWEGADEFVAECSVMLKYQDEFSTFNIVTLVEERSEWKEPKLNSALGLRFRDNITRVEVDGEISRMDYNSKGDRVIAALRKTYSDILMEVLERETEEGNCVFGNIISMSINHLKNKRKGFNT